MSVLIWTVRRVLSAGEVASLVVVQHLAQTIVRILVTALLAFLLALAAAYMVTEVHTWWYLREHGASARSELANDYNAAFQALLLAAATVLAVFPLAAWALWNVLGRSGRLNDRADG